MQYGIIDIGSNTVRLFVFKYDEGTGRLEHIVNEHEMLGLAATIDSEGCLPKKAIRKIVECLATFRRILGSYPVVSVSVFATAAIRNAKNRTNVLEEVYRQSGYRIDLLSDDDEARLGFLGALPGIRRDAGVLIDIGGGSTELTVFSQRKPDFAESMPLGSLNLTVRFVKDTIPTVAERDDIAQAVRAELTSIPKPWTAHQPIVYGIGGSTRGALRLARKLFGVTPARGIGSVDMDTIGRIITMSTDNRKTFMDAVNLIMPDRAKTIVAGMVCAQTIMDFFGAGKLTVLQCGVREGYLFNRVLGVDDDRTTA